MKKRFCIISILIIMLIPILCMAETPMQFLKTPVVEVIEKSKMSAHELYESDGLRATVAIGLQISLMDQEKNSDGFIDPKTICIGYSDECFYVVSAYSASQRAIFELDTKYSICKYRIEDDADMSQNEVICKELCPNHHCTLDPKEVESAIYGLMNN